MKFKSNLLISSFLICVIGLFISCGENSLFNQDESEDYAIDFKLLDNGSILENGQSIFFSLILPEDEDTPESLSIIVYSADGVKVAENTIEKPETGTELELKLPEFERGLYSVTFTLYGIDYILAERTLTFFYAESDYIIKGIESFPPVIFPGATVILKADLSIPEVTDPYLRWTQNEHIIDSGLYSEGLTEINWIAPMNEGVYSIALEIFPVSPLNNGTFSFQSQSRMATEVYVTSSSETISERDLTPEESYYSLFHFNGTYENSGTGIESSEAAPIGKLGLIQLNETLGYRLTDETTGISIPELIIPIERNILQPFTIEIGLLFESLSANDKILSIKSSDNSFYIDIIINEHLAPEAQINIDSVLYFSLSGIEELETGRQYMLSLSIIPDNSGFNSMWFLDGETYNTSFIIASVTNISDEGETIIGTGMSCIIDELGVYFMNDVPSSNPNIYYNAMKLKYNSSLIFADGFDSTYLSDNIIVSNNVIISSGILNLQPNQVMTLPEISLSNPENVYNVEIELSEKSSFTYSFNNSVLEITAIANDLSEDISSIILEINNTNITVGNNVFSIQNTGNIEIRIVNTKKSNLNINSLLAYTK